MHARPSPLADLIARRGSVVIDGAMSTALESLGADLNDPLWSAKVLIDQPELIRKVHYDYFEAGANVAITASYQASELGFRERRGFSSEESRTIMKRSVELAIEARRDFLAAHPEVDARDLLIAGAVGPYGAYLADGSEYTGAYHLSRGEYEDFHRLRVEALVEAGSDLLGVETMPRLDEVRAILGLVNALEKPITCWCTFTLAKDGLHIADGTSLEAVAEELDEDPAVAAIGLNCVQRELAAGALSALAARTTKPLVIYPNSGEVYDPSTKTWSGASPHAHDWTGFVPLWRRSGALCLGGCCRTLPQDIVEIARLVRGE